MRSGILNQHSGKKVWQSRNRKEAEGKQADTKQGKPRTTRGEKGEGGQGRTEGFSVQVISNGF